MGTERFIELSHSIEDGMETYPGIPAPRIKSFLSRDDAEKSYAPGTRFMITALDMVANTGTYIDAPYHRYDDGDDMEALSLESVANVPGLCVRTNDRRIGPAVFDGLPLAGKAVLVATGWSQHWGRKSYAADYPFLDRACGELLVDAGAVLVGIDSPNIDDNTDGERPLHSTLLRAGIPIVEHLTGLSGLPASGFRFFAVPPPIKGFTSFPVRAFALA